jgi:hypothetical protein
MVRQVVKSLEVVCVFGTNIACWNNVLIKGKDHIPPSNYHSIDNVPPNFQLQQCPPQSTKNCQCPLMAKLPLIKLKLKIKNIYI